MPGYTGFSSCGSRALKHRLRNCGAGAWLLQGTRALPGSGTEPKFPELAGGFFTTELPAKPRNKFSPHFVPGSEMIETQEDIYVGSIETDRGVREQVRFYDTRGLRDGAELPRHCFSCTDGYVLVYSTDSRESFQRVELLKKEIDKSKDKKEVCGGTPVVRDCRPLAGFGRPGMALSFTHLPEARFETGGQGWRPLLGVFTTRGAHLLR